MSATVLSAPSGRQGADTRFLDKIFDTTDEAFDPAMVVNDLANTGCVVLRNLFAESDIDGFAKDVLKLSEVPSIAGVIGYSKIDHPKKVFSPFLIGGVIVDIMLDNRVVDIIERYLQSECVLAEAFVKIDEGVGYVYFPVHAGFSAGWKKSLDSNFSLSAEDLKGPIGVGGIIYLHDTDEGAFCYCEGTHKIGAPRGQNLRKYPDEEQREIMANYRRVRGKKGDLVLFDDRGFHGPDQPSKVRRTAVILDYYRVKTFGRAVAACRHRAGL